MTSDLTDPPLGPRLRELRQRRGLSIKAASEQAGLSASFLSLVERGQSDLAMNRLMRLLQIYGASLTDLVEPAAPPSDVVRRGEELRVHSPGEHIDAYLLVTDNDRPLVPMVWVYAPGAAMSEPTALPTDHFSHVIAGSVTIETDEETVRLNAGDTIYVRAARRFRIVNDGTEPARVLGCGALGAVSTLPGLTG
ncbi:helix-turn-helix domain-containing protein [Conexibacter sp. CPCC 206217]|uniref:helix-turn-helix domain-containing protein n=1 Tax=Conexibacter sp. CPCC 206217 TaxID=3064574 RepID=UPI002728767E|nr:helix-turn-helix domain-containing protein [Conexibacter sp. CPCC 206217]MDO8209518.1 helix-turn-helix domain-containing protein [Conexibacter sp. CPCC 206217]